MEEPSSETAVPLKLKVFTLSPSFAAAVSAASATSNAAAAASIVTFFIPLSFFYEASCGSFRTAVC
jgi:hypothetical protein